MPTALSASPISASPIGLIAPRAAWIARSRLREQVTEKMTLVETTAALEALGPEWTDLFQRSGRPTQVFQTHAFASQWALTYLSPNEPQPAALRPSSRLAVLAIRDGGRLVMVWPLVMEQALGVRVLTWLGAPIAQYGDILIAPEHAKGDLVDRALIWLKTQLAPDVVRLRKVRTDAAIAPWLAGAGAIELAREEAPCVTLAACGTGSFDERQSAKARKNRRRLMRRLEEQGTVSFQCLAGCVEAGRLTGAGLAIKRRWLEARGLFSAAFTDPRLDQFFAAAAADAAQATGCTAFALCLDDQPIAIALGFACGGRMTLHVIGYDLEREKSGAGVLALEAVLRHCEASGFAAVDLLAPKAEYKLDWADGSVGVIDYALPVSLKGRACVRLYDGFLRPQAKTTLERLPVALRQLIAGQCTSIAH